MKRFTFKKRQRVVSPRDFAAAMNGPRPAADGTLVVFLRRRGDDGPPRLGVTIPKRTGNAPTRNRWKRWIRESFRRRQFDLPRGFDIVVRPKKGATGDWHSVDRSLPRLVGKWMDRTSANERGVRPDEN